MLKGRIVKALSGFYYVEADNEVYQCKARGKFRKKDLKPLVGDDCEFSKEEGSDGYILSLANRKNELVRPPICNVDQALLVFSAKEPDFSTVLLDRFLMVIEAKNIEPVICVSKIDLIDKNVLDTMLEPYIKTGYKVIYISAKQGIGLDEIKEILKDKVTVITGQSGVGKSSLLNNKTC